MRVLMTVTVRNPHTHRLRPVVRDAFGAADMIETVLGVEPSTIRAADETPAVDDYWVDMPEDILAAYTHHGIFDVDHPMGHLSALVEELM